MKIWKLESQTPEYTEIIAYWVNKPSVSDLKHYIANTFLSEDMLSFLLDQGKVNILYWDYLLEEIEIIENGRNKNKKFNHERIIDGLSYNTKNDKAFASAGNVTNKYMTCERLIKPAIKKSEIKEIILGGGQNLLSPERRFDAILFNSPGLFS